MMGAIKNKRNLQVWIIVVGCMLIQAIPFSVASNIQPQFVSYVIKGEGFSLVGFSLIFTIGTIVSAIASPIIGYLYSKINVKIFFLAGCIISGLGFAVFSQADTLTQFYLIQAIVQIGTSIFSAIGVPLIINSWFDIKLRGRALSIAFAGGSFGNIILQEWVVHSLITESYKEVYFKYGMLSLVVGILVTVFMLKVPPKNYNKHGGNAVEIKVDKGYELRELKKISGFWTYSIGFIFVGLAISALSIQYPEYIKILINTSVNFKGINLQFVGTIGALFAAFSLIGNLIGGVFFDKLGVVKTLTIGCIMMMLSSIAMILTKNSPIFAYIFTIFKGLSVYVYMMGPAYLTGYFFGKKNFTKILGITNLMFAFGFSIGAFIFTIVVSGFGYTEAWSMIAVFVVIAFIALIGTDRLMKVKGKQRNI